MEDRDKVLFSLQLLIIVDEKATIYVSHKTIETTASSFGMRYTVAKLVPFAAASASLARTTVESFLLQLTLTALLILFTVTELQRIARTPTRSFQHVHQ